MTAQRSVNRKGWGGLAGSLTPSTLPEYLPQWVPAGAWEPDPANSINASLPKPYGVSPGGTYAAYRCLSFPMIAQASAQYWYFTTAPPLGWTSTQFQFRVHFIVENAISLPGGYRFTLGARRLYDYVTPLGAKITGNLDYILADSTAPAYRITAISSAITVPLAASGEALLLELTRGVEPISDESDPVFVVGVELHWV